MRKIEKLAIVDPNEFKKWKKIMSMKSPFKDKSILITGGTGSFGHAFAKRLIEEGSCKKVIIFSRDEWKQWEMKHSSPIFSDPKMRYFLGDVRDDKRLIRAFNEVDIVVHAAALKQVPAAEYNPTEFIKTNVSGATNVIDAAIAVGVKKVIALSTDKAVNPINMYGASKLCSDKLFIAANAYVGARGYPTFSVVRYGNVSGSRGSVIPHWQKLIKMGNAPLPITDERMTRFWISLQESVDLVIEAIKSARGGEVYVPKIPSIHLTDLAAAMAPGRKWEIVGIRPGEKLHELMITTDDSRHTIDCGNYYAIIPESHAYSPELLALFTDGRKWQKLPEGFSFTSDNNTTWLKGDELKKRVSQVLRDENL